MGILKFKQIKSMRKEEAEKKMKELKMELMKEIKSGQGASIKKKEIRRTIAKLLTHLNAQSKTVKNTGAKESEGKIKKKVPEEKNKR